MGHVVLCIFSINCERSMEQVPLLWESGSPCTMLCKLWVYPGTSLTVLGKHSVPVFLHDSSSDLVVHGKIEEVLGRPLLGGFYSLPGRRVPGSPVIHRVVLLQVLHDHVVLLVRLLIPDIDVVWVRAFGALRVRHLAPVASIH